ncbi:hypothetical protein ILYODFUR_021538 [Ilyodon furcidens]|uniref:Uncharacterized protein n=1 Tax=Ilyodon furcidens TaxID=33524 RepID=A0ABV0TCD5_9TELE
MASEIEATGAAEGNVKACVDRGWGFCERNVIRCQCEKVAHKDRIWSKRRRGPDRVTLMDTSPQRLEKERKRGRKKAQRKRERERMGGELQREGSVLRLKVRIIKKESW